MKQKILLIILFSVIFNFVNAQCKQQFVYICASSGCSIYLKDFNTVLLKDKNTSNSIKKFTFEVKKGTHYRLSICSPDNNINEVFVNLYNSNDSLLVSNYRDDREKYGAFDFICQNTDNYYITVNSDFKKYDKIHLSIVLNFVGKNK